MTDPTHDKLDLGHDAEPDGRLLDDLRVVGGPGSIAIVAALLAAGAVTFAVLRWHLLPARLALLIGVGTAICGNSTPASRIGTRKPVNTVGAPSAPSIHGSTSLALLSSSATLFSVLAAR